MAEHGRSKAGLLHNTLHFRELGRFCVMTDLARAVFKGLGLEWGQERVHGSIEG